jgi:major membrane immunogen (membrane-anchored lipoprotein)
MSMINRIVPLSLCTALFLTACSSAVDKQLSSKPTASQLRNGDYQVVNADNPGQKIDVKKYLVRGKYTVIEFQSEY